MKVSFILNNKKAKAKGPVAVPFGRVFAIYIVLIAVIQFKIVLEDCS